MVCCTRLETIFAAKGCLHSVKKAYEELIVQSYLEIKKSRSEYRSDKKEC